MKNQNGLDILTKDYDLKSLAEFSEEEITKAGNDCPAISRYINLISRDADGDISISLRLTRHLHWLTCALNTYYNPNNAKNICKYWSDVTETLLRQAFSHCELDQESVLLGGFGKLGAGELNLSSDIDIIFISERPAHQELIKKVQKFSKLLSEQTEFGFCYRVDFDLRPGGRLGPFISSAQQLQDYYWSQGETWERMAYLRFKAIAGSEELSLEMQKFKSKFCFRKFIDMTLFDDLKNLRGKIQSHNIQITDVEGQLNLKLDIGAIRDIELFLHANVIIHGGRHTNLQCESTSDIYEALTENDLLKNTTADLLARYWELRVWENLVQIKDDSQTHILSLDESTFPHISQKDCQQLLKNVEDTRDKVSKLLGDELPNQNTIPQTIDHQEAWLSKLGYSKQSIQSIWPSLLSLTAKSKKKSRDEQTRRAFLFLFIEEIAMQKGDKNLGLSFLHDFVKSVHVKATFFTLLLNNPVLVKRLAMIFSVSPYLSNLLISRPELIDSLLYQSNSEFSLSLEEALDEMAEHRLLTEVAASIDFLSQQDILNLSDALSSAADYITKELLLRLHHEYGQSQIGIVAMGKWGGQELGLASDLDFIFVTESTPTELDNKIARRMISRLQDEHRGGKIYSVDLRLRPSGNAGPMLVEKSKLKEFLVSRADAWQRQSYLRARSLCNFITDAEIYEWSRKKGLPPNDLQELKRIKTSLLTKGTPKFFDIKFNHGGLVDIEFAAQQAVLFQNSRATHPNTLKMLGNQKDLQSIYVKLRTIEQLIKLITQSPNTKLSRSSDSCKSLSLLLGFNDIADFQKQVDQWLDRSQLLLKDLDPLLSLS